MLNFISRTFFAVLMTALLTMAAHAEAVYNRGQSADPQTLDPHKVSLLQEGHIIRDLFEGLVSYDAKAKIIPGVAESWSASSDGSVYTFKLRKDAKWSDGTSVTADDFVYSWRRLMDPKTGSVYSSMLFTVKNGEAVVKGEAAVDTLGVRAIDPYTFEATLTGPTPFFVETLVHPSAYPVPAAVVQKLGAEWVKPGNMVSNGAFVLQEFNPKDKIVAVKNATFHDAANVALDKIVYHALEDRGAALKRFEAGEIDAYDDIPVEQIEYVKEKFPGEFLTGPSLAIYFFWVKTDKPPYDNVKLRRALALMVDREYLADKIWSGTMAAGYSVVPPGMEGFEPVEPDFKALTQLEREEEAKKLMTELGYGPGNPLKIELSYDTSENHRNTLVAVADMMKPFGIEATLLNRDKKSHFGHMRDKGDYDLGRANWYGDFRDPQTFLQLPVSDNGLNYAHYKNKDYDTLVNQSSVENNVEKRREMIRQAQEVLMRDHPMLMLMHYRSKNLVSKRLKGWETNNVDTHFSRWLSKDNAPT